MIVYQALLTGGGVAVVGGIWVLLLSVAGDQDAAPAGASNATCGRNGIRCGMLFVAASQAFNLLSMGLSPLLHIIRGE